MIRIRLPQEESQRLDHAYRREADPKFRDRIQIIRLAARGRPHAEIAEHLAVNPRTVQRWLNVYLGHGLDGLRPRKAPGKPGKIPADLADEVKRWVIEGPAAQGLDRANWTHAELAEHLFRRHGVRTSRSAVQRLCRKLGVRPYRPTYRYLRGDPARQQKAREDLDGLKKKRRRVRSSC